ncbi:MAG: DUF4349 domain-containing protein [Phycisphaeraceae bacterium]
MAIARPNRKLLATLLLGLVLGALLVAIFLPALGAARSTARRAESMAGGETSRLMAAFQDHAPRSPARDEVVRQGQLDLQTTRRVIYTTHLQLRVADPAGEATAIEALLAEHDGFVEARDVRETSREGQYTAELTLRVPADRLDTLLPELRGRSIRVLHEQQRAADVTDQHADLDARLRNLRHAEQELRTLMTELRETADDVDAVMQAYRELTNVREQIERYEAQLQRLEQQVALATVHLQLLGPDVPASVADPEWRATGVLSHAGWSLVRGLQVLATVVIYAVVTGLPLVLIVAAPVLGVALLIRRLA